MIHVRIVFSVGEVEERDFLTWNEALSYVSRLVNMYWVVRVEMYEY